MCKVKLTFLRMSIIVHMHSHWSFPLWQVCYSIMLIDATCSMTLFIPPSSLNFTFLSSPCAMYNYTYPLFHLSTWEIYGRLHWPLTDLPLELEAHYDIEPPLQEASAAKWRKKKENIYKTYCMYTVCMQELNKGKVWKVMIVKETWPGWMPGCRQHLPQIQALYSTWVTI